MTEKGPFGFGMPRSDKAFVLLLLSTNIPVWLSVFTLSTLKGFPHPVTPATIAVAFVNLVISMLYLIETTYVLERIEVKRIEETLKGNE